MTNLTLPKKYSDPVLHLTRIYVAWSSENMSIKEWISTRGLYHFYQTLLTAIMMKSLESEQRGPFG